MVGNSSPTCRAVRILGSGHTVPTNVISSATLDETLGLPSGKVYAASGVCTRYFANAEENAAVLGSQAAHLALERAGIEMAEVDCIVATSATMDQGLPSNAVLIHEQMGLSKYGIPAFDINASCLGFLAAIDSLSWMIEAQRYKRVLLVAADIASCALNWQSLESSAIFGDGAAAVVLEKSPPNTGSRVLSSALNTWSEGAHYCEIRAGGSRYHPSRVSDDFAPLTHFSMNGKKVFRLASVQMPKFLQNVLLAANTTIEDLDWIVPHQASHLAMQHISSRLGFAPEKVVDIFPHFGNQVAASLPTALDIAIGDGRIQRGDKVLLLGTGAGLSLGAAVIEY